MCGTDSSGGIDRVDSQKHYTLENSQPCCSDCNYFKKDLNLDSFLDQIYFIIKNSCPDPSKSYCPSLQEICSFYDNNINTIQKELDDLEDQRKKISESKTQPDPQDKQKTNSFDDPILFTRDLSTYTNTTSDMSNHHQKIIDQINAAADDKYFQDIPPIVYSEKYPFGLVRVTKNRKFDKRNPNHLVSRGKYTKFALKDEEQNNLIRDGKPVFVIDYFRTETFAHRIPSNMVNIMVKNIDQDKIVGKFSYKKDFLKTFDLKALPHNPWYKKWKLLLNDANFDHTIVKDNDYQEFVAEALVNRGKQKIQFLKKQDKVEDRNETITDDDPENITDDDSETGANQRNVLNRVKREFDEIKNDPKKKRGVSILCVDILNGKSKVFSSSMALSDFLQVPRTNIQRRINAKKLVKNQYALLSTSNVFINPFSFLPSPPELNK